MNWNYIEPAVTAVTLIGVQPKDFPGKPPYSKLASRRLSSGFYLNEATEQGAAAVILEINTFGGRVDGAVLIRDALLNARVRTVAFVNKRAISAGALISLAAEKIVMAGGGTIGRPAWMATASSCGETAP